MGKDRTRTEGSPEAESRVRETEQDSRNPEGRSGPHRRWIEKLKKKQAYVAPTLISLSGHAALADPGASIRPRPQAEIPVLDPVGMGVFVGGLAAAGGIMIYRKLKAARQKDDKAPDDTSKK